MRTRQIEEWTLADKLGHLKWISESDKSAASGAYAADHACVMAAAQEANELLN